MGLERVNGRRLKKFKLVIGLFVVVIVILVILGVIVVVRVRKMVKDDNDFEIGMEVWFW